MKKTVLATLMAGFVAVGGMAADVLANESRLERIKETGILVAGYRETSVPFSYLDPNKPAGFGAELSERILEALKDQLGRDDLRIRWNPVTLSTRIPLMTTNTLDILCATDTHTRDRAEMVNFSLTFYVSEIGAVVAKDVALAEPGDLRGKRIAVPAGSTVERMVSQWSVGDGGSMAMQSVPTNRQAMRKVQVGEADAFVNSSAIVAGELFRLPDAERFKVVALAGEAKAEPFGCMLPKGDTAFKGVVDEVLRDMMKGGEMASLYDKWFNQPIPPFGKAVNLPLNEATRAIYAAPNDHPM